MLVVPPMIRAKEQDVRQRRAKLEEDLRSAHIDLKGIDSPQRRLIYTSTVNYRHH